MILTPKFFPTKQTRDPMCLDSMEVLTRGLEDSAALIFIASLNFRLVIIMVGIVRCRSVLGSEVISPNISFFVDLELSTVLCFYNDVIKLA